MHFKEDCLITAGTAFERLYTLQGCPNSAHHKLSRSRRIYLLPGRPDQSRNPGSQDISTMVKQDQQSHPNVPTNPDRSCAYLVLRAHRIVQTSGRPAQSCPWWPPAADKVDQHSEEHWPGGGVNNDDPWASRPKGKKRLGGKW